MDFVHCSDIVIVWLAFCAFLLNPPVVHFHCQEEKMSRTHIPQFTVELLLQAVCTFLAPHYQCYVSLCPSAAASSAAAACPCDASKLVCDDVTHMPLSTDTTPTHSGFSTTPAICPATYVTMLWKRTSFKLLRHLKAEHHTIYVLLSLWSDKWW